jgi:hypothetical protein
MTFKTVMSQWHCMPCQGTSTADSTHAEQQVWLQSVQQKPDAFCPLHESTTSFLGTLTSCGWHRSPLILRSGCEIAQVIRPVGLPQKHMAGKRLNVKPAF